MWTDRQDSMLKDLYRQEVDPTAIAKYIGKTPSAVKNRAYKLEITDNPDYAVKEITEIIKAYTSSEKPKDFLIRLSQKLGRPKQGLSRYARRLGLTSYYNGNQHRIEIRRCANKGCANLFIVSASKENLRQKHCCGECMIQEVGQRTSKRMVDRNAKNPEQTYNSTAYNRKRIKGWRVHGGRRFYFKSLWEMNYACYLDFLISIKQIAEWDYECHTFWFDNIKRGVRSYTPDFRVVNSDGGHEWHEVKGYYDSRSKTKMKRMAIYYPDEKMRLIDKDVYLPIRKRLSGIIPGWSDI